MVKDTQIVICSSLLETILQVLFVLGGIVSIFFSMERTNEGRWRRQEKSFQSLIIYVLPGTSDNYNELIYLQRIRDSEVVQFFHLMLHISMRPVT